MQRTGQKVQSSNYYFYVHKPKIKLSTVHFQAENYFDEKNLVKRKIPS